MSPCGRSRRGSRAHGSREESVDVFRVVWTASGGGGRGRGAGLPGDDDGSGSGSGEGMAAGSSPTGGAGAAESLLDLPRERGARVPSSGPAPVRRRLTRFYGRRVG